MCTAWSYETYITVNKNTNNVKTLNFYSTLSWIDAAERVSFKQGGKCRFRIKAKSINKIVTCFTRIYRNSKGQKP